MKNKIHFKFHLPHSFKKFMYCLEEAFKEYLIILNQIFLIKVEFNV